MGKYTSKNRKKAFLISPLCRRVLAFGIPPILLSLIITAWQITAAAPLTVARAAYFGGMLEHHVAAIAILTVGAYIAEYASRTTTD